MDKKNIAIIPYRGRVTDLTTGTPIPNVSVTDGRNVVKTDANGCFELTGYYNTHFITVTIPAGYTTDDYYIAVNKENENIKSYDFKLEKSEATAQIAHGFVHISDTEIGVNGAGEKWVSHVKQVAEKTGAAFLIHTGDICYEAGLRRHKKDMNTANMGLPVKYVIGNHDYVAGKFGEELFESIYGPVCYSFEVGNVHYAVTPIQFGDHESGYDEDDRWRWLENDIAAMDPDMKLVIFNHTDSPSKDYVISYGEENREELDLKKHNLIAWIFGHYHYHYIEENDGVLNISTARPDTGGIDSSPSGTRYVSIDENGKIETKLYYYDMPSELFEPESIKSEIVKDEVVKRKAAESENRKAENCIWSTQLDSGVWFTDTLRVGGRIYTATANGDYPHDCGVYCLDEKTGDILWKVPTKNAVKNNLVYAADGNVMNVEGMDCSTTGSKILAQDADGTVICVNADTGEKIWEAKAELEFSLGTTSGICADETAVYAGTSSDVTALSLADGKVLWTYHRNHGENSFAEFIIMGDRLIISPHWDALAALDKTTGKLLWENQDKNLRFRSSTPIAVDEKTILAADDRAVMFIDAKTGDMISKTVLDDYYFASSGQPAVDQKSGMAYIPTVSHGVIAFDMKSKKILWEALPENAMVYTAPYSIDCATVESTPVLAEGKVIFGASDGSLYRVDTKNGEVLSKIKVGAPVFGKAAVCEDGSVVVADFAGRVKKVSFEK